jgi:hypothetical protein
MNAANALRVARDAGIDLRVDGNDLVLEASAPPPNAVLDLLSSRKVDLIRLLSREAQKDWSAEDWLAFYEERAAIAEFDGGQSREQAEALAFSCCIAEWLNRNPATSNPDSCARCRQPDTGMHSIVPFSANGPNCTWLHPECWGDWYAARKKEAIAALQRAGLKVPAGFPDDHGKNEIA